MSCSAEPHALVGQVVGGRWRLERVLGEGAMSTVLEANHVLIGRRAAVKVLKRHLAERPDLRACFLREARAVNWVNHVNIAEVYDHGESEDDLVFLVMELLEGERLSERLDLGPVDPGMALDVVEQVTAALARAHDLGVIHRDLKPEHVFLVDRGGRTGFVKLIDFGLARLPREGQLGLAGALVGTPGYISPEVLAGAEAGPASDLYALGVMFFEMVTGRPPFEASDPAALHQLHCTCPVPNPCELIAGIPAEVGVVITRLLEKDPSRRYNDAYRVLEDCRSLVRGRRSVVDSGAALLEPASSNHASVGGNQTLAAQALTAVLLARMASSAYPRGGAPREVEGGVEDTWQALAQLCRVEGELEVTESVVANARARAREASDAVALQIAELSRHASRMARRIEGAREEIQRLDQQRRQAGRQLKQARREIRALERQPNTVHVPRLLHEAGVLAARQQVNAEAITKVHAKVDRWGLEAERAGQLATRLREQFRTQNERVEAELAHRELRLIALYSERERLLSALGDTAAWLRTHFERRRECQSLMAELVRIAPRGGGVSSPVTWGSPR